MISDFEQRLVDVLGGRLPAPFAGHAHVAPGPAGDADPAVVVRVESAMPLESGLGGEARQVVPGAADPRRVVRMACVVEIAVAPESGQGRAQQMQGVDAVLYLLDAPDFRNGAALAGGAPDPGFLIRSMHMKDVRTPPVMLPGGTSDERGLVRFDAEGWFWPTGTAGEAGIEIESVRIRGALAPVTLMPAAPRGIAGGDPIDLTLRVREMAKPEGGDPDTFSALVLRLVNSSGGPGAGSLAGAVDGILVVDVVAGEASFSYEPPDDPARLELVVALDDGDGGAGLELERFPITVVEE